MLDIVGGRSCETLSGLNDLHHKWPIVRLPLFPRRIEIGSFSCDIGRCRL
jgi:hypothetical protein